MKPPKISIITALFNAEETVEEAIRSIRAQTYHSIEHVIIDGGSTDRSLEIVTRHASPGMKIISETDHGLYDALNKGIALSTGDIIGFVHGDDFLGKTNAIRKIAHAFTEQQVAAVYGDLEYISRTNPRQITRVWTAGQFAQAKLKHGWMPPHPTFYARRSVYEEFGTFDTRFQVSGDYDFLLRFLSRTRGTVTYLPDSFYKMRSGGVSSTKQFRKMQEDYLAIRRNNIGGLPTLMGKSFSKIPQFFRFRKSGIETTYP